MRVTAPSFEFRYEIYNESIVTYKLGYNTEIFLNNLSQSLSELHTKTDPKLIPRNT